MVSIGSQLHIGEAVHVTLMESGCRVITVVPAEQSALRVSAVGPDYIVVDDEAAGVKTRIPAHFIKLAAASSPNGQEAA